MPSDPRIRHALDVLAPAITAFRSALAATIDDVARWLASRQAATDGRVDRVATELGALGARHVDVERFASLFDETPDVDGVALETVERALTTLHELAAPEDDLFICDVAPDRGLQDTVDRALASAGRAFGAARVVRAVRTGQYHLNEHARSLGAFPFARWSRAERRQAPPLVVSVAGEDLRPAGLAEYLDGRQKIVLVVTGPSAPAPLVRLVTPGTYVLQTEDRTGLDRFAAWEGPGIAALMPPGAAQFEHRPDAGTGSWAPVRIVSLPAEGHRRRIAGWSVAQQLEELQLLTALACAPAAVAGNGAGTETVEPEPADKLAAWLLKQADLTDRDGDG